MMCVISFVIKLISFAFKHKYISPDFIFLLNSLNQFQTQPIPMGPTSDVEIKPKSVFKIKCKSKKEKISVSSASVSTVEVPSENIQEVYSSWYYCPIGLFFVLQ